MPDEIKTPEGGAPSGAQGEGTKEEVVSKKQLDDALKDLHRFKEEARTLKSEREAMKTQEMKQKEEWKKLAELKEAEATEAKAQAERIQSSYLNEKKFSSVKESALKLGLRAEALVDLDMVSLDEVQIEKTSTGKINVLGSDKFAERLKATRPHWFSAPTPPNINSGGGRILEAGSKVTIDDVYAAENEGRKTGNMSKYHELAKRYRAQ